MFSRVFEGGKRGFFAFWFFALFCFFFIFRIFYDTCLPPEKKYKTNERWNDQSMKFTSIHPDTLKTLKQRHVKKQTEMKVEICLPFRNAIGSFWLRRIDQDHYSRSSNEIRVVIASLVSEKYNVCLLRFFGNLALWYLRNRCLAEWIHISCIRSCLWEMQAV